MSWAIGVAAYRRDHGPNDAEYSVIGSLPRVANGYAKPMVRRGRSGDKQTVTHIVLIDDHELVRCGLKTLLRHEPDLIVVGEADAMASGIAMVKRMTPHLVVLDGKLPGVSVMDACRRLFTADPKLRILVLCEYAEDTTMMAAVQSGAHGYALKDLSMVDLAHAIRTVANGHGYLDPRVAQKALQWIRTSPRSGLAGGGATKLTPQERLILPLLAEGKTNKEIAVDLSLSHKTVKNYLASIFDKLHLKRRTEAVAWFLKQTRQPAKVTQGLVSSRSQWEVRKVQEVLKECRKRS